MTYTPVPATTDTISRYAAFLGRSLKFNSVKQYLNIIRIMHLEWGLPNPIQDNYPISSLLRGMRRSLGDHVQPKLPITPEILRLLLKQLDLSCPLDANVWSICLLLFYGLLRKASVLPNTTHNLDPNKILCREDVKFHQWGIMVTIRTTKTIQFQERSLIIPIPRHQGSSLCPVNAMVRAFASGPPTRAAIKSPAFRIPGAHGPIPITGPIFVNRLRQCLRQSSLDINKYSGHSFRRGGATWMYKVGIPTETIRAVGDWRSTSYLQYITVSPQSWYQAIRTMQNNI